MRAVLFVVGVLFLSACGGNSPTAPSPAPVVVVVPPPPIATSSNPNVIGSWSGTMRSQIGALRAIRMTFTGAYNQTSYGFSGTWSFVNTSEGADLFGLVQSNPFSFRINASTSSPAWCSYNVTLSVSGNIASGDYSTSVCFARPSETGTVTLSR